ncbi:hypothetical protein P154DRAFT_446873, partial [Amniculicola lignicola CBS 123094]
VYVNNLEERVKIDEMKNALIVIFSRFGNIIDIVMKCSIQRKGQAFVVFSDHKSAVDATIMDGFVIWGKPMHVNLAKTRSDKTVETKASPEELNQHKKARTTAKERKQALEAEAALRQSAANPSAKRPVKTAAQAVPDEFVRPNKILFLQHFPEDVDQDDLTAIFDKFDGFVEVRYLSRGGNRMAFAEYENEQYAITAKEATANMPVGASGKALKVTYQRQ